MMYLRQMLWPEIAYMISKWSIGAVNSPSFKLPTGKEAYLEAKTKAQNEQANILCLE